MTAEMLDVDGAADWRRLETLGNDVLAARVKLVALLRSNGGGKAADYLAEPVFDPADARLVVGWRSPHGGRLVPSTEPKEHDALAETIDEIAERLDGLGDAGRMAAHSLRSALVTPEGAPARFMDEALGAPVLVNWGLAAPKQATPAQPTLSAPPRPTPVAPETGAASPFRGALLLLPWIVPASLAALAIVLGLRAIEPLPVEIVEIIPDPPPAEDPAAGLDELLARLDAAIEEADAAAPRFAAACVAPPPEPEPEPAVELPFPLPEITTPSDEAEAQEASEPPPVVPRSRPPVPVAPQTEQAVVAPRA
ncbi:MAG: hypothetical protein AAGF90_19780, partial [Pseudomonadota bacterium]